MHSEKHRDAKPLKLEEAIKPADTHEYVLLLDIDGASNEVPPPVEADLVLNSHPDLLRDERDIHAVS
jgi:hypothetical protein